MSILSDLIGTIGSTNLRDYAHASKIFVADNYRLMPKYGFLYYVSVESNSKDTRELGMLAKSVQLPKYSIDLKKINTYNKPTYVQTKIQYDPISITFHDDSADVVRNFWFDYYNYYYADSRNNESLQEGMRNSKYAGRPSNDWGYTPRKPDPFLKSIRLYSLHQKRFSEYVIVNPIIKSFQHGEHQAGANETMQNTMTIEYETVLYYYGTVSENTVPGFLDLHYDKHPSPLTAAGGGTASILGQGGLVQTADEVIHDLANGNYGSALFKASMGLKNASSMDLKKAAIGEVLAIGTGVLQGNNPTNGIFIPSLPGLSADTSVIGDKLGGLVSGGGIGGGGIGAALGIGALVAGGGIGGSTGGSGGGIGGLLAGAVGLGIAAFSGKGKTNQEMTDATTYLQGIAPATGYDQLPQPTTEEILASPPYNTSTVYNGPETLSVKDATENPTNQGTVNSPQERSLIENNLNTALSNKQDLQVGINELKDQQQLSKDAIDSFNAKRVDLIFNQGLPVDHPLVRQLETQVDQQQATIDKAEQSIAEKHDTLSQLNNHIDLLNVKKAGLG